MLLISRSSKQAFTIDTPQGVITILVLGFDRHPEGMSVHLGVDAPKDFAITRDNAVKKSA